MGDVENPIKVSLNQFYGIEINDFAVTVAKTALWISEDQMMKETEEIIHANIDFLPLKSYANIVEGNALRMDWEEVIDKNDLNYIMGNPPFVGGMWMTQTQKNEIRNIYGDIKGVGELDYVTAWYKKAAIIMQKRPSIRTAFVSTNSITQGMHPGIYWKHLVGEYDVQIIFAYDTFKWNSEATLKANVHVVIIGFVNKNNDYDNYKYLYVNDKVKLANKINGYLVEASEAFIKNRTKPICESPKMSFGNMPRDGGGFILNEEEKKRLIDEEPISEKWIHPYLGAAEYINNKKRYCLWLVDAEPNELRKSPTIIKRIQSVRDMRLNSKAASTRKMAEFPTRFAQITQPVGIPFLMIPRVSSQRRRYIPVGFLPGNVIASDESLIIPGADLYILGVIISNVHMGWMRSVAGRLKSDYRYSKGIVYNNFPWPNPTQEQKQKIEKTAQAILDARDLYPTSSLADLYDELTMPKELRRAHQENDKAVMEAYGFDWRTMTESECVAELMKMYQDLVNQK